ncbi:MAG: carbon-nitrogen hydrolase family protein [Sphingorhabdus sp.]|uniref:carbon-nitrogen hydrolase family protein n=1 Tax=Sphingorhabdus sp. TaxID=1902408 RepID=UPI0025EA78B9|nr:carbon-nitrogen hydrolase family protein [Sphingorhabdus sp.]MCO4092427.1 carbon-nitrogen hydrolase family protein [Sphingorhabdus sp.]
MRVALHQMTSTIDPMRNAADMADAIASAAATGAVMYFAPEMAILVDRDRARARKYMANESHNMALHSLIAAAARHRIWVHIGSMPILDDGTDKLANRSIIISPDGTIAGRYDKMHLFDVDLASGESWRESSAYIGGEKPVMVQTPLGLMGLAICYDMRFPDLFSAYAKSGVDIMTLPSAFTVPTGEAHWHTLLRARAIESAAFIIAAAQCGVHEDGRQTYGHSLVVDPWGTILLDMGGSPGLACVDLDLDTIKRVRKQIPVHANRRVIPSPFIAG